MHTHKFDPISGWCTRAAQGDLQFCGHRDDGRRIMPFSADVIKPGTTYSQDHLAILKDRIERLLNIKYPPRKNRTKNVEVELTKQKPAA